MKKDWQIINTDTIASIIEYYCNDAEFIKDKVMEVLLPYSSKGRLFIGNHIDVDKLDAGVQMCVNSYNRLLQLSNQETSNIINSPMAVSYNCNCNGINLVPLTFNKGIEDLKFGGYLRTILGDTIFTPAKEFSKIEDLLKITYYPNNLWFTKDFIVYSNGDSYKKFSNKDKLYQIRFIERSELYYRFKREKGKIENYDKDLYETELIKFKIK